jgi:DNA-binding beta-propeller fold protein YncE
MPAAPSGLALARDDSKLFVTYASPQGEMHVPDLASGKTVARVQVGHTAMAPVLSPNGETLYVSDRFDNEVRAVDLCTWKEVWRLCVQREPVAASITHYGRILLVTNLLPTGRVDADPIAVEVSVIDVVARRVSSCKMAARPFMASASRLMAVMPWSPTFSRGLVTRRTRSSAVG